MKERKRMRKGDSAEHVSGAENGAEWADSRVSGSGAVGEDIPENA